MGSIDSRLNSVRRASTACRTPRARRPRPPARPCRTPASRRSPDPRSRPARRSGSASSSGSPMRDRDEVVAARGDAQRPLVARDRRQEIGDQEGHRLPPHHVAEELQPGAERGPPALLLEGEDLAHHAQHVPLALLGRHELLHLVGEDDEADPIVVADRREGQHRRQLGRQVPLLPHARAEPPRGRHVDQQEHRHLALLGEELHVGVVHARRDVPVDEPDVVARDVLPHLGKGDAAPLEDGVVLPRHPIAHQALGDDLDLPDALEELARQHRYGTSTRSNSLRTTVSVVISSASAS